MEVLLSPLFQSGDQVHVQAGRVALAEEGPWFSLDSLHEIGTRSEDGVHTVEAVEGGIARVVGSTSWSFQNPEAMPFCKTARSHAR